MASMTGSPAAWSPASTLPRIRDLPPHFAINGGVYGKGVQDGLVAGPEVRFDIAPFGGFNFGIMAAYDYQFRNAGWDEGILWAGLDLGIRF